MSLHKAATRLGHLPAGDPRAPGGYGGCVPLDPVGQRAAEQDTSWKNRAACARPDVDPTWFFPPDGTWWDSEDTLRARSVETARRAVLAKQVCARCPVITQCRAYVLIVREPWGVWGGLDQAERARLLAASGKRGGR